jgi:para-aminobenzoate synthetase/4-amino-4-deoxychorismate lyase
LTACHEYDDVILWNEKGEVTESCIANIVVELDGELYTPPVRCGLLAGTFRARLIEQDKVREKVIRLKDLARSPHIYLVNSVRKNQEVVIAQLRSQKIEKHSELVKESIGFPT